MSRPAGLLWVTVIGGVLLVALACGGGSSTGPGVSAKPEAASGTVVSTEPGAPVRPSPFSSIPAGSEDGLVLSQGPLPEVANVDYSRFPNGADPSSPGGNTYHVSPAGDDTGAGTLDDPFRTIEQALSVAGDGDKVLTHGGTYSSDGLEITQSAFVLASYEGEPVTVEAADGSIGLSIASPSQHDVSVRGFTLLGFADVGIYLGNPDTVRRVVLEDMHVDGSAEGLAGAYEEGVLVEGLLVRRLLLDNIGSIGFQFGVGEGRDVRIAALYIRMSGGEGDNSGLDALAFEQGSNVLIESSIVEGASADGIDLKASRVAVVNTIVRHIGRNGIKMWDGGDVINALVFDTGADAQVVTEAGTYRFVNSTFGCHLLEGGTSYAATFAYDEQGTTDVTMVNNVFFSMPSMLYFAPSADVHLDHNVFYGFPDSLIQWGDNEYGPSDLGPVFGATNVYTDPGFIDPAAFDFHPAPDSDLRGAGSTAPGTSAFDLLGTPRTGTNTVGAYQ